MLDNGALGDGGVLGASSLTLDAVTEGEDVLVALVLKSVRVHIDETGVVRDASLDKLSLGLGVGVDAGVVEDTLSGLTGVDVPEGGNLLANTVLVHLDHLPAEHHVDATLVALVKSNLVGVAELVDLLVRGPVLDTGVGSRAALELILSEEGFVVEGVEIATLTFIGSLGRIADEVAVVMVPAVLIVTVSARLVIEHVHEHVVLLRTSGHLLETFDLAAVVVEACRDDKGLVSVLLAVRKKHFVLIGHVLDDPGADVRARGVVHLRADGARLKVEGLQMMMGHTEVSLRDDVLALLSDESHLPEVVMVILLELDKLGESGSVMAT